MKKEYVKEDYKIFNDFIDSDNCATQLIGFIMMYEKVNVKRMNYNEVSSFYLYIHSTKVSNYNSYYSSNSPYRDCYAYRSKIMVKISNRIYHLKQLENNGKNRDVPKNRSRCEKIKSFFKKFGYFTT